MNAFNVSAESLRDVILATGALERLKLEAHNIKLNLCVPGINSEAEYFDHVWFVDSISEVSDGPSLFLVKDMNAAVTAERQVRQIQAQERSQLVERLSAYYGISTDEVELKFEAKLPQVVPVDAPPLWHVSQWFSYLIFQATGVNTILMSAQITLPAPESIKRLGRKKLRENGIKRPFVFVESSAEAVVSHFDKELESFGRMDTVYESNLKPSLIELVGLCAINECRAVITVGGVPGYVAGAVGNSVVLFYGVGKSLDWVRWEGIPSPRCKYLFQQEKGGKV